jgi:ppGpp synthetase/RelA/SpoT-type nucleotidyltranferase
MDLNTQQRQIFEKILNSNMIKIVKENLNDNIRKWANKVKQEAEPFVNKSVSYITENAFNGYEAIHSILEYDGDDMEVLDVKDLNVLMEAMKILRKLELKYSDENHTLKRAFPNSNKIIK